MIYQPKRTDQLNPEELKNCELKKKFKKIKNCNDLVRIINFLSKAFWNTLQ